ncbi:hypothetical protein ACN28E_38650 [Archangium lansingense]|uniref:hypothetical protein n=1 Tax=Archangium lansingense TaxID=2995310 RepID=UPI003B80484C
MRGRPGSVLGEHPRARDLDDGRAALSPGDGAELLRGHAWPRLEDERHRRHQQPIHAVLPLINLVALMRAPYRV